MQPKIVKVIDVQIFPVCVCHADIRTWYGCARCGYPIFSCKIESAA